MNLFSRHSYLIEKCDRYHRFFGSNISLVLSATDLGVYEHHTKRKNCLIELIKSRQDNFSFWNYFMIS